MYVYDLYIWPFYSPRFYRKLPMPLGCCCSSKTNRIVFLIKLNTVCCTKHSVVKGMLFIFSEVLIHSINLTKKVNKNYDIAQTAIFIALKMKYIVWTPAQSCIHFNLFLLLFEWMNWMKQFLPHTFRGVSKNIYLNKVLHWWTSLGAVQKKEKKSVYTVTVCQNGFE